MVVRRSDKGVPVRSTPTDVQPTSVSVSDAGPKASSGGIGLKWRCHRRRETVQAWPLWIRYREPGAYPTALLGSRRGSIALENGAHYAVVMRTISVRLPEELLAQLGTVAKARRVTKSWLVRESLEKGLHEQPSAGTLSCYDLARDLAGTLKGLPKDLADDPRYMEGFGQ
jgi:hypothetical protein